MQIEGAALWLYRKIQLLALNRTSYCWGIRSPIGNRAV